MRKTYSVVYENRIDSKSNWQAAVDSWQLKEQPSSTQGNYTFNNTPRTPPVERVIVGGVDVERRTYTDEQLESLFCTLEDAENL